MPLTFGAKLRHYEVVEAMGSDGRTIAVVNKNSGLRLIAIDTVVAREIRSANAWMLEDF